MFQTDIIRFLQSFNSETLTHLMKFITALGYEQFFVLLIIAIMSGVDFRKGFIILHVLVITGLITQIAKEYFALPRPWFVDSSLSTFGKQLATEFESSGASTFFTGLPHNIIGSYRQIKPDSYGFPSGHTSTALVLWSTVIVLFNKRWIKITSICLIILVPLSRLYLARHFPADILGGYILGGIVLLIAWLTILNKARLRIFMNTDRLALNITFRSLAKLAYLLLLPVFFYFMVTEEAEVLSGYLLGANIAYILISHSLYPKNPDGIKQSVTAILTTPLVFAVIGALVTQLLPLDGAGGNNQFIKGTLITFPGIYLSNVIISKIHFN